MLDTQLLLMAPVVVRMKDGTRRVFGSVNDVLELLEGEQLVYRGRKYGRAVQTCRRALKRITPVAIAREAFIYACRDAGILAEGNGLHSNEQQWPGRWP
ncbi:DUF982 domain-containing protein (plasmid) [Ensifer adhaerens]|uniref:DUF982 domain-containing protein n=1 Tax=Ensifer adhaerens TaxID=106592 RepID=UPI001CC040BF|nr:DUF982 domain-containing protein [Ensifer adhaerens]MBZ7927273.1 DUF982 domain-containing protein [Ensifer adhaerens]UAX98290.1 DUF982 domain-containing protein [Ensifer adhaerens]UAY05672.1 DUF982 domain-containing protein [Ensifer adhaerens]UAY13050.1 DUF982 domain-containing protein [Ensifer adhaerens]